MASDGKLTCPEKFELFVDSVACYPRVTIINASAHTDHHKQTVGDSVAVKDTDLEKVKELMLIAGKRKTLESGTEEAAELEKMMLSHPEWTYDELTHLDDQTEKEQNK